MNFQDLLMTVILPTLGTLLTALSGFAILWINKHTQKLKNSNRVEQLQAAITELNQTVDICVIAYNQTNIGHQKTGVGLSESEKTLAKAAVLASVYDGLTMLTKQILKSEYNGTTDGMIQTRIEAAVAKHKTEAVELKPTPKPRQFNKKVAGGVKTKPKVKATVS